MILQLLEMVCEAFNRMNANVVRASSGADLIEQLATAGPFDLVVTDISMPWMSGLQAMRATRSAGLATPVIVMTAVRDERVAARVKSLGENAVLLRETVPAECARVCSFDASVRKAVLRGIVARALASSSRGLSVRPACLARRTAHATAGTRLRTA